MVKTRDPDRTRDEILRAAFHEIHRNGFQGASLDQILKQTGVTKGALYHHFPNKKALGLAVVDEIIAGWIHQRWIMPMRSIADPILAIRHAVQSSLGSLTPEQARLGCPLLNVSQEMSPIDEDFRRHLSGIFETWRGTIAEAIRRGQEEGMIDREIEPVHVAAFVVATFEGIAATVKASQSLELGVGSLRILDRFLEGMRVIEHSDRGVRLPTTMSA